jgi:hypothetical protein
MVGIDDEVLPTLAFAAIISVCGEWLAEEHRRFTLALGWLVACPLLSRHRRELLDLTKPQ